MRRLWFRFQCWAHDVCYKHGTVKTREFLSRNAFCHACSYEIEREFLGRQKKLCERVKSEAR